METKVALLPSLRSAFTKLIDYAGLFPPAKLSLPDAASEYRRARTGAHAWMLGRFIIPASLLDEARPTLGGGFSVIVDSGLDAIAHLGELRARGAVIEALEVPPMEAMLGQLRAAMHAAALSDLPAFVEIARGDAWLATLASAIPSLAQHGLGAKLRCGGVTADAFPSVDEVAEFIAAASAAQVPFKATAGLHHPVRHIDPTTGFPMHGFLNLLAATALAPRVSRETLRCIVAEEDAGTFRFEQSAFTWRDWTVQAGELQACRERSFVSYGSCSFSEPVEDLTALGILPSR